MPAETYNLIATTTLTGTASSYTFNSIPQTFTDLIIIGRVLNSSAAGAFIRVNGDTNTNYSTVVFSGFSTNTVQTNKETNRSYYRVAGWDLGGGTSTNNPVVYKAFIENYSSSTQYKTIISEFMVSNATSGLETGTLMNTWRNTNAITSLTMLPITGGVDLSVGTTFSLYGIKAE